MPPAVEYGVPLFTSGVFGRASAQDDLGFEEVGAALLRRLVPGVIQNTPNAGYYSFYPYLLWKWEQLEGAIDRSAFKTFYRRHEAAYSVACALHQHRHGAPLSGINGAIAAGERVREFEGGATHLDLEEQAAIYMDTPLGGYGLFYAATLVDARLVQQGAGGLVDRVTDHGAEVAEAFASAFEDTAYARDYFESSDPIPVEVLRELGDAACLCTVPGRSDHQLLLHTLFGEPLAAPDWEERRQSRVRSLCMLLEFHDQRPAGSDDGLPAWRRALLEPRFSTGETWRTGFPQHRQAWRAYQLREVAVLALTTIWSLYLNELARRARATHGELTRELTSWLSADRFGLDPGASLADAMTHAQTAAPDGYALALEAEPLESEWRDERQRALCRALRVLLIVPREISRSAPGFDDLLDEGGDGRWSLEHLNTWLDSRADQPLTEATADLLGALHHQHVRVALQKVRVPSAQNLRRVVGGWRDPFNFAEDEGVLRPLRPDEPFWTGARYGVLNHLLWSLGLLTSPTPPFELTALGHETLERCSADA